MLWMTFTKYVHLNIFYVDAFLQATRGLKCITGRPGERLAPVDFAALRKNLEAKWGKRSVSNADLLSAALYPQVFSEYRAFREKYGPVDTLPTNVFLAGANIAEDFQVELEKGKTLHIKLMTVGELDPATGRREVFFELNGQLRSILVADKKAQKDVKVHPKADKSVPGTLFDALMD